MRHLYLLYLVASLTILWGACSSPKRDAAANAAACNALSKVLGDQEQLFINQAQTIRAKHVLLQDYDRQMISAITDRRSAIQATELAEFSVTDEVAGCSGQQLEDLRRRAQDEMANLRDFLKDFNRALKTDPQDVFIDAP